MTGVHLFPQWLAPIPHSQIQVDHPQDISCHLDLQHYKEQLEALLESKLDNFREEVHTFWLEAGANQWQGGFSIDGCHYQRG
jgi:hypothetical protein